jgi:hypothetical protein
MHQAVRCRMQSKSPKALLEDSRYGFSQRDDKHISPLALEPSARMAVVHMMPPGGS